MQMRYIKIFVNHKRKKVGGGKSNSENWILSLVKKNLNNPGKWLKKVLESPGIWFCSFCGNQRWSRGHKAWGQGQGHKKKSEAKAKDSLSEDRPSRGQGQESSRPRTNDTAASVFQKKKGLLKSFSGNLQFIGVARIFGWRGLNHKSHAMTSSKICLLAFNQDFAKREGFN